MAWSTGLQTCRWGTVSFQVERTDDSLTRRLARYEYPYRDGADLEDLGREPRPTSFTAVYHGPEYEADLGALLQAADRGRTATFVHPVLGQWRARLQVRSIRHEAGRRDGAVVEIEVLEDGTDAELDTVFSVYGLSAELDTASSALSASVPSELVKGYQTVVSAVTDAVARAEAMQDAVNDTVLEIERRQQEVRAAVRTLVARARAVYPPNQAEKIAAKAQLLGLKASQFAEAARLSKPAARQHTTALEGPATLLVAEQSQTDDPDALDAWLAANRVRNPNRVPAGETVVVYQPEETP